MNEQLVGTRVELLTDTFQHHKGERGVIASLKGHIGVLFDNYEGLTITFAGMPILNFCCVVSDERAPNEREPAAVQMSLFE